MAAKLESTIHKLPAVKRDELLGNIQRIRAQLKNPCRGGPPCRGRRGMGGGLGKAYYLSGATG